MMTSMQRVLTTLGHREPDRVPLFLFTIMQGANELGLSIRDYFSRPEHVIEGQLRLLEKYRGDCLSGFFYAAAEPEAFGAEVIYREDGPPNCGPPIITDPADIDRLRPPAIEDAPGLRKVLTTIRGLKARVGDTVPILGVVISPFSVPVMQMGFEGYLNLLHDRPDYFERLMGINAAFCVAWANAQLAAGATAIGYFDPLASPTNIPPELYRRTGLPVARRVLAEIRGPVAVHLASGRGLPILADIAASGAGAVGVSALEDLAELKAAAGGRLALLGNLNGIEMRRWTPQQAEAQVRRAIAQAGRGGGFILSDNHGEIPWQVPESVLLAITEAVERWGRYPLDWIDRASGAGE